MQKYLPVFIPNSPESEELGISVILEASLRGGKSNYIHVFTGLSVSVL